MHDEWYAIITKGCLQSLHDLRLVWPVLLAQVVPPPQLSFPSKSWFFEFYLNFQRQKSFKNQYLPYSESKSQQINSIKSCSSRSFEPCQRHITIPRKFSVTSQFNFSVKKSFNTQELLHLKSKHHGTKPMHPSSSRAFQRHQEHYLKHPGSVDFITTKQNKLPSFIDRCLHFVGLRF